MIRYMIPLLLVGFLCAQEAPVSVEGRVLPLVPQLGDVSPGQELWLSVAYRATPTGEVLFQEPGEKLWWVRQSPLLLLGSSGLPLPKNLTSRATLWVSLQHQGEALGDPVVLYPRRDMIAVTSDQAATHKALVQGTQGLDATYLAQVANFIAGNLGSIDVEATAFNITGYGEVINSAGEWVGEPITAPETRTLVYLMRHAETTGIGSNPDLSADGMLRVANLQSFFANVTIDAFFSSHLARTIQTVEPLATERGLSVNIINNGDPTLTVQEIQARQGQTLMVAGHSNTIPLIIQMLGGPVISIGEAEYSNLFLMVLGQSTNYEHYILDP